jgi:hypothetical protein
MRDPQISTGGATIMKRRTFVGLVATAAVLGVGATAFTVAQAHGPGGMHGAGIHGAMMKWGVTTTLDAALGAANVTADQRAASYASRDRVFATFHAQRPDPAAHRDQLLALFEGDRPSERWRALQ